MANLLPKTATDFTSPQYWKLFFASRKLPFEWYGDYDSLGTAVEKYVKPNDKILQIGCGNSIFASQLYDNGFRSVHSIDLDERVIAEQKHRNSARKGLTFAKEDATALSALDESVSVVIDKGTLDALLPPSPSEEEEAMVHKMFDEVTRVLSSAGRYVIVTLAQDHLLDAWRQYFSASNRFMMRIHEIPTQASGFCMPVFLLVAIKLKLALPMSVPLEFIRAGFDKPERITADELTPVVKSEQELSRFITMCSQKLDDEVSIQMQGSSSSGQPRYRFVILDNQKAKQHKSFSVFIVPVGSDNDWIFSTAKGRQQLLTQVDKDRLMIVFLSRSHKYESLDEIKAELNSFVVRFDPRATGNGTIEYLSVGKVDVRKTIATGKSEINGAWTVEEVEEDEKILRRLVFNDSAYLVQSECYLKVSKKGKTSLDSESLSCDHHNMMVAAMALHASQPLNNPDAAQLKVAVLGLGGGLLATFLLQHFPKCSVTGVELDGDMVQVARQHFGFPAADSRASVRVMDALDYLAETSTGSKNEKLDILLVDVAGTTNSDGLSCPPAPFLQPSVIENMKAALRPNGILALNLVTRNTEIAVKSRSAVQKVFPNLFDLVSGKDLNELLIGFSGDAKPVEAKKLSTQLAQKLKGPEPWKTKVVEFVGEVKPVV